LEAVRQARKEGRREGYCKPSNDRTADRMPETLFKKKKTMFLTSFFIFSFIENHLKAVCA
jgi:hypothetical protein